MATPFQGTGTYRVAFPETAAKTGKVYGRPVKVVYT
jgi:hypothetical protein